MPVTPTTPKTLIAQLKTAMATALSVADERIIITPAPELIARLPAPSGIFAALIPQRLILEESPQHPAVCPAQLHVETAVYSRVAVDRGLDGQTLLLDAERGLFPLAGKLLNQLAGNPLITGEGQLLRHPLQCSDAGAVRWLEGSNIVLAYLSQHWIMSFEYDLD